MAVYSVHWNINHPTTFLSCGADWMVKLWESSSVQPIMSFDLSTAVGDVQWCP